MLYLLRAFVVCAWTSCLSWLPLHVPSHSITSHSPVSYGIVIVAVTVRLKFPLDGPGVLRRGRSWVVTAPVTRMAGRTAPMPAFRRFWRIALRGSGADIYIPCDISYLFTVLLLPHRSWRVRCHNYCVCRMSCLSKCFNLRMQFKSASRCQDGRSAVASPLQLSRNNRGVPTTISCLWPCCVSLACHGEPELSRRLSIAR